MISGLWWKTGSPTPGGLMEELALAVQITLHFFGKRETHMSVRS